MPPVVSLEFKHVFENNLNLQSVEEKKTRLPLISEQDLKQEKKAKKTHEDYFGAGTVANV